MPFQNAVNVQPAPAVAGDFASSNPRWAVMAGPGGLVAGASGVTVGRFAWLAATPVDIDGSPTTVNSTGAGPVAGFVSRRQQALITSYLAEGSNVIPAGFPVTVMSGGDYWVRNEGGAAASVGQKAFAKLADGSVRFGAAGATIAGYVETKWTAMSAGADGEIVKIASHPLG